MLDYIFILTRLGLEYILRVSMIDSPSDNVVTLRFNPEVTMVVTLDYDSVDSVDDDCGDCDLCVIQSNSMSAEDVMW